MRFYNKWLPELSFLNSFYSWDSNFRSERTEICKSNPDLHRDWKRVRG